MYSKLTEAEYLAQAAGFLAVYYALSALMNLGAAGLALGKWRRWGLGTLWLAIALLFGAFVPLAAGGTSQTMQWISVPQFVENTANFWLSGRLGPPIFFLLFTTALVALFIGRRFLSRPAVAWGMLNIAVLLFGFALTNRYFADVVGKPDNVAIVLMLVSFLFFTWLATYKAVLNDERLERDEVPLEKERSEKVLVWPDLVYIELIAMVVATAGLIAWSILLKAPLEGPADAASTPNPSKAPWYFAGLQEMLTYHEAWYAGVVVPTLILFGLMAIPYLDVNREGDGYYTINQRKFAYLVFQLGMWMWLGLIVLAVFFRGPSWIFFSPFEPWDPHRVLTQENIDLSQVVWSGWLGRAPPAPAADAGALTRFGCILLREWPGLLLLSIYFLVLPPLLARTWLKNFYAKMGLVRYTVMIVLLLLMILFPLKMLLYWTFDLRTFVFVPEYAVSF
jgi:hypothetical protein